MSDGCAGLALERQHVVQRIVVEGLAVIRGRLGPGSGRPPRRHLAGHEPRPGVFDLLQVQVPHRITAVRCLAALEQEHAGRAEAADEVARALA